HRHILGRRIEIFHSYSGAAIDILEARIVLQHQIAVELLGLSIRTHVPAIDQRGGASSSVSDIDIAVLITQVAVTQVAAQRETVVEIMAEAAADIGALNIVEVVTRLTEERVAIIFPVLRVTATVGCTVPAQMIHYQRGRSE